MRQDTGEAAPLVIPPLEQVAGIHLPAHVLVTHPGAVRILVVFQAKGGNCSKIYLSSGWVRQSLLYPIRRIKSLKETGIKSRGGRRSARGN
jgi:hypothetical protein